MERLTGLALLHHNKKNWRYVSRSELIRAAGYIRIKANGEEAVAYTAYYDALITAMQYQATVDISNGAYNNPSKSPAINNLIRAIRYRDNYDYRTDSVVRTGANFYRNFVDTDLNIYHQNKIIASIDFKRKIVIIRISKGSKSDKERLNRILMYFCGCNLFHREKVWAIVKPFCKEKKVTGCWTEVSFLSIQYPR